MMEGYDHLKDLFYILASIGEKNIVFFRFFIHVSQSNLVHTRMHHALKPESMFLFAAW